ncbi:MAG: glycerol kinase GlpK [Bacteroidota bacterium]
MKEEKYILSIDQGTTSSRAVLFDKEQNIVCIEQKEIKQYYPFKGWVEQSPEEIWQTSYESALKILEKRKLTSNEIAAIGITNQRETTIVWDKKTGKPLHRAIVWQDTRTAKYCEDIKHSSYFNIIKRKTGLLVDSYFSATKIKWILDKYDKDRERSKKGELLFGTIDTWLLWKLTNGELHYTDYSNASRTMLFDINKKDWSNELLDFFNIPKEILPKIKDTSEVYGYTGKNTFEHRIPVSSLVGDQQAALFGHQCVNEGMVKNTYGTGCFMLMNTGRKVVKSNHGLLSTIAWHFNGQTTYALEGSVFVAGAVIQWLRDQMGLINHSSESEILATKVDDNNGVYFVPAFTGLGAPHWDGSTQGAIIGLTRDSNKYHIVRAALESMAYQTKDVLYSMVTDSNIDLNKIYVDGGAVDNNFLMQFQSDILNADIIRTEKKESTALGSALLAGLAVGYYSKHDISDNKSINKIFKPEIDNKLRTKFYTGWLQAVDRVKNI